MMLLHFSSPSLSLSSPICFVPHIVITVIVIFISSHLFYYYKWWCNLAKVAFVVSCQLSHHIISESVLVTKLPHFILSTLLYLHHNKNENGSKIKLEDFQKTNVESEWTEAEMKLMTTAMSCRLCLMLKSDGEAPNYINKWKYVCAC